MGILKETQLAARQILRDLRTVFRWGDLATEHMTPADARRFRAIVNEALALIADKLEGATGLECHCPLTMAAREAIHTASFHPFLDGAESCCLLEW